MPDHWGFVVAAYALTALVLSAYWRRLARRERELAASIDRKTGKPSRKPGSPPAGP
jgi:hypothetical protein